MGLNRWAKGVLGHARSSSTGRLPPLSYLPLMIIWLGIGETSKITLLVLAMFAPICLSAQARCPLACRSSASTRPDRSALVRLQLFTDIVLPSALPEILDRSADRRRHRLGAPWSLPS